MWKPRLKEKVNAIQKILLILAGVFLVYSLLGFFVVPPVVRIIAEKDLSKALKRPTAIRKISFNPYNLTLTVYGLSVAGQKGGRFISVGKITADFQIVSVFKGGVVLRELVVNDPYVRIVRNEDFTYNFSDLISGSKKKKGKPLNFCLDNIIISGGRVDFDDRPKKASHVMDEITIMVPFISNFRYDTGTFVHPAFYARLDGRPVDLKGETKPFAKGEETLFNIRVNALNIPKYMEYLPKQYKLRITSGTLSADGAISFVSPGDGTIPRLLYQGNISLDGLKVDNPDGSNIATLSHAGATIQDAEPLAGDYKISSIIIDQPGLNIVREADGQYNVMKLLGLGAKTPPKPQVKKPQKIRVELRDFSLSGGRVNFTDMSVPGHFKTAIKDTSVSLAGLDYGGPPKPASFKIAAKTETGESLAVEGNIVPRPVKLDGKLALTGIKIARYSPYYAQMMNFSAKGTADVSAGFSYGGGTTVSDGSLLVKDLKLARPEGTFTTVKRFSVNGFSADLEKKTAVVDKVESSGAVITVLRGKNGTFNLTTLFKKTRAAPPARRRTAGSAKLWQALIKNLLLGGYRINLTDETTTPPVNMSWSGIRLYANNIGTRRGTKARFKIALVVGRRGRLNASGSIVPAPFSARVAMRLKNAPIQPVTPYMNGRVNMDITAGSISGNGNISMSYTKKNGFSASYAGDASVDDFNAVDKADNHRLIAWKSLSFKGLQSGVNPWISKMDTISLAGFYSRIAILPDGKTNLQGVVIAQKGPPAAPLAGRKKTPYIPSKPEERPFSVKVFKMSGGTISFSDDHIKPHYRMKFSDTGGSVTGLSSNPNNTAALDLKTRINGVSPAEISGKIKPLPKKIYADIAMRLRGMELPPTSPYSRKFIGYDIINGQLSLNLHYLIEKDTLKAGNDIKLDQFDLSEKPENPKAAKLPVRLVVALLKDRNGLIDLDVPISGNLKDPKFSLGGVIWVAIRNTIIKLATEPFALIGKLFGGGADLGYIDFPYGRAALGPDGIKKLNIIAKALHDRPKLKLEITGRVDTAQDNAGLRQVIFMRKIKAAKYKDMGKKERPSNLDDVVIKPDEYNKYLKKAYKAEKFKKPTNFLGLDKSLPPPQMEKLMMEHISINREDLRRLSAERAGAVRDYLMTTGKVAPERLFVTRPEHIAAKEKKGEKGSRVDFSLG